MSITQFFQPFEQKTIEQLLFGETANQDSYSQICSSLASDKSFINEKFVRDWIYLSINQKNKINELEVKLKRIEMVGLKTTYELLDQDNVSLNFQSLLMRDKIYIIEEQIKDKKKKIPQLNQVKLEAAKFETQQIIQQIEQLQQQLKEYNTDLQNHQLPQSQSSISQQEVYSQNFSDEQTVRNNQFNQGTQHSQSQE